MRTRRALETVSAFSGWVAFLAAGALLFAGNATTAGLLFFVGLGALVGRRMRTPATQQATIPSAKRLFRLSGGRTEALAIGAICAAAVSLVLFLGLPPPAWSYLAILGSCVVSVVLASGLADSRYRYVPLTQIVIASLLIRALGWFAFPPAFVGVDSWYHSFLIADISKSGGVPSVSDYEWFPLMQIAVSMLSQATGLDIRTAMFVAIAVPVSVIVPLVLYSVTLRNGGSYPAGIFAAFLFATLPDLVYWGYTPIPMSLSLAYLFLALLLTYNVRSPTKRSGLVTLVFLSCLLTHTIGSFVLASYFAANSIIGIAARKLGFNARQRTHTAAYGPTLFIALFAYWSEASGFVFPYVVRAVGFGLRLDAFIPPGPVSQDVTATFAALVSSGIVLFLAVLGSMVATSAPAGEHRMIALLGFAWVTVGITFFGELGGFSAILPARWSAFSLALLCFPAGLGFSALWSRLKARRASRIAVSLLVVLLVAGITLHPGLSPARLAGSTYPRLGFLQSETASSDWVHQHASGLSIVSDPLMTLQLGSPFKPNVIDGSQVLVSGKPWVGLLVLRQQEAVESIYVITPGKVFWHAITISPATVRAIRDQPVSVTYDSGSTIILAA